MLVNSRILVATTLSALLILAGCMNEKMPDGSAEAPSDTGKEMLPETTDSTSSQQSSNSPSQTGGQGESNETLSVDSGFILGNNCNSVLLDFPWPLGSGPGSPPHGWETPTLFLGRAEYINIHCDRIRWGSVEAESSNIWLEMHDWMLVPEECELSEVAEHRVIHHLRTDNPGLLKVASEKGIEASLVSVTHEQSSELMAISWEQDGTTLASWNWIDTGERNFITPPPWRAFWNPSEDSIAYMDFNLAGDTFLLTGRPGMGSVAEPLLATDALVNQVEQVDVFYFDDFKSNLDRKEIGEGQC